MDKFQKVNAKHQIPKFQSEIKNPEIKNDYGPSLGATIKHSLRWHRSAFWNSILLFPCYLPSELEFIGLKDKEN